MTNTIINWQNKPQQEGWYATLYSWDVEERIFADANYWDGNYWDWAGPVIQCAGPFESKDIAGLWACTNNPENY